MKGTRQRGLARLATRINGMWFDYGKRHVQRPGLTNVVAELPRGRVSRFSIGENFTLTFSDCYHRLVGLAHCIGAPSSQTGDYESDNVLWNPKTISVTVV